jgi:hypothetical protein
LIEWVPPPRCWLVSGDVGVGVCVCDGDGEGERRRSLLHGMEVKTLAMLLQGEIPVIGVVPSVFTGGW